ncbi:hypothetical protein BUALT_Bualt05G0143700 [Buddleja alternifolia]|uniref:Uncharacterized protein n=1 Tax=Buddleja alternifolia TaxID=168488 RepID=A0AAV6XJ76_9LAMI|nr:hypothetical protein BUALT_Bualt05G0143700 [Buddleja alternifolia]
MGVKRPLEEEDFPGPSFKHKQLDYYNNLTLNTEEFPSGITTMRVDFHGEAKSNFCKLQLDGKLENGDTDSLYIDDKELESSVPLSVVTSSSSEEDVGNGDTSLRSYFPGDIDYSIPRRPPQQFEDPYISLLNCPPRKGVPIGPDNQAEVPKWDPDATGKSVSAFDNKSKQKELMGTCIISMPNLNDSTFDGLRIGRGRTDCKCLDVGSMRCVQQHVMEAREKLQETMGDENFTKLGFYDMGDEVACKWTPHDEQLFHEVVFSNPASHGRNFWKHLRVAFPNRTNKDIVSYYFNVFMLRRRAVQNRSYSLEIDSDDDEERRGVHGDFYQNESHSSDLDTDIDDDQQGPILDFYVVEGDGEDSTVESLGDEDLDSSWVDDFWCDEPENGSNGINGISEGDIGKKQDAAEKLDDDPGFDS